MSQKRVIEFDLDRYLRASKKVDATTRAKRRPGWAGVEPMPQPDAPLKGSESAGRREPLQPVR